MTLQCQKGFAPILPQGPATGVGCLSQRFWMVLKSELCADKSFQRVPQIWTITFVKLNLYDAII